MSITIIANFELFSTGQKQTKTLTETTSVSKNTPVITYVLSLVYVDS